MDLTSRGFYLIFAFIPLTLLGYYLLRQRAHKYRALLAASWIFYIILSPSPWYLGVILFTTIVDYFSGQLIESAGSPTARRRWLWLSIASNLGFLAIFKYTGFAVGNSLSLAHWLGFDVPTWVPHIVLPLGISFHTFQGISYTLDVYRGKLRAVHSFVDFALFVAFFPQLMAGPIVRATTFLPQMTEAPGPAAGRSWRGCTGSSLG